MYCSYYLTKSDELNNGKIPTKLFENSNNVFEYMAQLMIDTIEYNNKINKPTVYILPVGPVGQYSFFVEKVKEKQINLASCWFINMDEYLNSKKEYISLDDKLSFRAFMNREVYSQIPKSLNVPISQRIFPNPNNLIQIEKLIEMLGGVDIAFGGIGINGHLAFNEPKNISNEDFLELNTRVLKISKETKIANCIGDLHGALENMPDYAVTIGMKQIFGAKKIVLGVFRDWHRAVVRRAVFGKKSSRFPVSLLQDHKDSLILINDIAGKELD